MPAVDRGSRLWMILAFITGMIFTAVLVQTLVAVYTVTPAPSGDRDYRAPPAVPDDGYLVQKNGYELVYTCPDLTR